MANDKVDILIVDDLPEKVLVYRTVLDELGENLVVARSGEEAGAGNQLRRNERTSAVFLAIDAESEVVRLVAGPPFDQRALVIARRGHRRHR